MKIETHRIRLNRGELYQINLYGHPDGVYSVEIDSTGAVYNCMVSKGATRTSLPMWVDVQDKDIPPAIASAILDEIPKAKTLLILESDK